MWGRSAVAGRAYEGGPCAGRGGVLEAVSAWVSLGPEEVTGKGGLRWQCPREAVGRAGDSMRETRAAQGCSSSRKAVLQPGSPTPLATWGPGVTAWFDAPERAPTGQWELSSLQTASAKWWGVVGVARTKNEQWRGGAAIAVRREPDWLGDCFGSRAAATLEAVRRRGPSMMWPPRLASCDIMPWLTNVVAAPLYWE